MCSTCSKLKLWFLHHPIWSTIEGDMLVWRWAKKSCVFHCCVACMAVFLLFINTVTLNPTGLGLAVYSAATCTPIQAHFQFTLYFHFHFNSLFLFLFCFVLIIKNILFVHKNTKKYFLRDMISTLDSDFDEWFFYI